MPASWTGTTVTVSTDGVHTLRYRSTDVAGNVEDVQTLTIKIDQTAPTITDQGPTTQPNGAGWYNAAVTETFQASDATSGVAGHGTDAFTFTKSSGTAEGAAVTIASGTVTDRAGNVAASVSSAPYKIDLTKPITTATPAGTAGSNDWYKSGVSVTLAGTRQPLRHRQDRVQPGRRGLGHLHRRHAGRGRRGRDAHPALPLD